MNEATGPRLGYSVAVDIVDVQRVRLSSNSPAERALIKEWGNCRAWVAGSGTTRTASGERIESVSIYFERRPEVKQAKRVEFFFRWFDLWVGAYVDRPAKAVYICPIPMFGVRISYA